eukprot:Sspe_Gene.26805::Locus_11290_Transcript_1_1_Confidence_1.000_Length_561::g.26805::m.26805
MSSHMWLDKHSSHPNPHTFAGTSEISPCPCNILPSLYLFHPSSPLEAFCPGSPPPPTPTTCLPLPSFRTAHTGQVQHYSCSQKKTTPPPPQKENKQKRESERQPSFSPPHSTLLLTLPGLRKYQEKRGGEGGGTEKGAYKGENKA